MSGIATGTGLLIGGLAAGGAGIAGAAISSNAAQNAASTQAGAAEQASQLQYDLGEQGLGFQEQQWAQNQANLQPWLQGGANGLANLQYLMGIGGEQPQTQATGAMATLPMQGASPSPILTQNPNGEPLSATLNGGGGYLAMPGNQSFNAGTGQATPASSLPTAQGPQGTVNPNLGAFGSLMQAYPGGPFVAPTALTEQNDPGYQARLNLGLQAEQQSAAARGNLLTGGTLQAENQLAQDYASNEYSNVYNRALNTYGTNYNAFEQNQANKYNRLASMAGIGQTTAQQLGSLGVQSANSIAGNLSNTGAAIGQQMNNAAAANASGYVGSANAWSGGLNNAGSSISNLLLMNQLLGGRGNAAGTLAEAQGYGGPINSMDTGDYTNLGYI